MLRALVAFDALYPRILQSQKQRFTPVTRGYEELAVVSRRFVDLWDSKGSNPGSLDDVLWRQKSIQFGSRKKSAERVATRYQLEIDAHMIKDPHTLEICQIMFERPDEDPEFSFSDADFSHEAFDKLREVGFTDMETAIKKPSQVYPKDGEGVKHSALYRYGTLGKHRSTDSLLHLLP